MEGAPSASSYENTLIAVNQCFVYRINPHAASGGYKAGDWADSDFIWSGRLVIVERGDMCVIKLINKDNGDTFAECPVSPGAVEPVTDSSRYFVLRIEDKRNGRHAFIGMGFQERNEAFDFNATLQDHARRAQDAKDLEKRRAELASQPTKDYSIPVGQTITVALKGPGGQSLSAGRKDDSDPGVLCAIAPPPGGRKRPLAAPAPQQQQQGGFSLF
eukprot:m51a1_g217 hypothetical protein (216) ;mRNA; f:37472-38566